LTSKTVKELRSICAEYNIRCGSGIRKTDLVLTMARILNPSQNEDNEVQQLLQTIKSTHFQQEPAQHQFYRTHFNSVDLHDKIWYKIEYNYQVKSNWRVAYLFAVMKVAMINAWVLHNELARKELQDYLLTIADFLIHLPNQN